jgi:hypothetical protein
MGVRVHRREGAAIRVVASRTCPECGRVFDMCDDVDAEEWWSGHDCEV